MRNVRALAEMRAAAAPKAPVVPRVVLDDDDERPQPGSRGAGTGGADACAGVSAAGDGGVSEDEDDAIEGVDPYAGMSARERKLHELRARLQQCRRANQTAVVAEKKRLKGIDDGDAAKPDDKRCVQPLGVSS